MDKDFYRVLGLSKNEAKVISSLHEGITTPLTIAKHTKISRPTVYLSLQSLHKRGLVYSSIVQGKKAWHIKRSEDVVNELQKAKQFVLNLNIEEHSESELKSIVKVYRNKESIKKLLFELFSENKNTKLHGMQGNFVGEGWRGVLSLDEVNKINSLIKKNKIIVDALLPKDWFKHQYKVFGKAWAEEFIGRTTSVSEIPEEYFRHAGEIFIFKDSLYLLALEEEMVIEVKHSQIQKLVLAMFSYAKDNSNKVDINHKLREIIAKDI